MSIMVNSFHDLGKKKEGASALSFFSSGEGLQTKIAKDRKRPLHFVSFPLQCQDIFFRAAIHVS